LNFAKYRKQIKKFTTFEEVIIESLRR